MPHIIVLGTLDTKLQEILYLKDQITAQSQSIEAQTRLTLIDCGRQDVMHEAITVSHSNLIEHYGPAESKDPTSLPRGEVIRLMTACATSCVRDTIKHSDVHGIVSAGGSGGSSLACTVMREAAPIGLPKLMVSTVASGDTGPFIGETDIAMMYSVADIAGNNTLLKTILGNAAGAILGMARAYEQRMLTQSSTSGTANKVRIGVTMFGVTTPCVDKIRQHLEANYEVEVYIFHATGHGGKAMERLVNEGGLDAVLDLTTTEICDHLMGGNMSAGGDRLEAALKKGLPYIISVGACDMVNFAAKSSVPQKYQGRKLLEHNPTVTLMRTTGDECDQIGAFIANKIKSHASSIDAVEVWLPKGGISLISIPGAAFADEEADTALMNRISQGLGGIGVKVVEDSRAINDEGFAVDVAEALMRKLSR